MEVMEVVTAECSRSGRTGKCLQRGPHLHQPPCGRQGGGQEESEDLGPPAGSQRSQGVQAAVSTTRSVHCWWNSNDEIFSLNPSDVEGVIKYLDYYIGKDNNSFLLVMERPLLYKDLFEIISDQEYLEENAACFYFKQLVSIVINCQKHGVIHRDIKPENVLVNLITNKVTLIDFGSGDFIQENFYTTYDGEGEGEGN